MLFCFCEEFWVHIAHCYNFCIGMAVEVSTVH